MTSAYAENSPRVEIKTSMGPIEIALYRDKAPITVDNFLTYIKSGFYDELVFHRVVYGWLIQGGGYNKDMVEFETLAPIKNEADNGLKNLRGTIAMARHDDPHSADSQFFINLDDNHSFDHKSKTRRGYGYCVFGKVVKGMGVADAISDVEKQENSSFGVSVPVEPVIILQARVISE